jgi:DedD protein
MAKELTDEEQNLQIKARRRLVGAVALTLAVVVILPMVLESEPKSSGQDIELRIPAPEQVAPLVASMPLAAPVIEPAASQVEIAPVSAVPAVAEPTAPKPEVTAAAVAPKAEAPAAPAPAAKPGAEVTYVVQVGAYSNAATAKKQYAQLKSWGFKAYTEKSGNTTRVRVGPYAEREKVEKIVKLLEKHDLKSSIVTLK